MTRWTSWRSASWATAMSRGFVVTQTQCSACWGRIYWEQAESKLTDLVQDVNRVLSEDVAAFRIEVGAARLDLFPEEEPLTLDWVREN